MLSVRYDTLVGEGWTHPPHSEPAKNRNNYCGRLAASCSFEPERVENSQTKQHTIGTRNRKTVRDAFGGDERKPGPIWGGWWMWEPPQ